MAWTSSSKDIMSGTPAVADYAEYLAETYSLVLNEATSTAAAQLQTAATARAKATSEWSELASHVEVFPIDDFIAVGTQDPRYAEPMRTLEYGEGGERPASPVLTTTMTSMIQPMRQTMQTVIDEWLK